MLSVTTSDLTLRSISSPILNWFVVLVFPYKAIAVNSGLASLFLVATHSGVLAEKKSSS